jgi:hypothetical protein
VSETRRIVVLGGIAQLPYAGVAWQVLHFLEGFRRLGHDVTYVEDTGNWPYDPEQDGFSNDARPAVRRLERVMRELGFADRWAYRDAAQDGAIWGMPAARFDAVLGEADVLVNLSGMTLLRERHMSAPIRIYLETDPVNTQIAAARGDAAAREFLEPHTVHFSFGERLGRPGCRVPVDGWRYRPTRQPVILDWWPPSTEFPHPPPGEPRFTTVASWEQTHRDVEWEGETYTWSKSVEFLKLLDVPRRAGVVFAPAFVLDDPATLERLEGAGWRVQAAAPLSRELEPYREFVRGSTAEFSAAKEQNVRLCTGWFSDRSATYLAAGRPVVVQDTGFGVALPTGRGLLSFTGPEEAVAAMQDVIEDYPRHSRAARELAEDCFRAEAVLARLLEEAGA